MPNFYFFGGERARGRGGMGGKCPTLHFWTHLLYCISQRARFSETITNLISTFTHILNNEQLLSCHRVGRDKEEARQFLQGFLATVNKYKYIT